MHGLIGWLVVSGAVGGWVLGLEVCLGIDRPLLLGRLTRHERIDPSTHTTHTHTHTHTHTQHTQAPPPLPDVQGRKMDAEDARVVDADVKRTRWVVCCLFTH